MERFIDAISWPQHLMAAFPDPKANASEALNKYFAWTKGDLGLAEFIAQCAEAEIPEWIREVCRDLRKLCQPPKLPEAPAQNPPPDKPVAEAVVADPI